jgi:hypothetical protein
MQKPKLRVDGQKKTVTDLLLMRLAKHKFRLKSVN